MFRLSTSVVRAGLVMATLSLPVVPTLANDDDTMLAIDALVSSGFQARCALHYGVGSKRATQAWVQNMRVFDKEFLRVYGVTLLDISKNAMHAQPHQYIASAAAVMANKSQSDIDLMCSKSAQGQREVLTKLKLKGNHDRIAPSEDPATAGRPLQSSVAQASQSHSAQPTASRQTGYIALACDGHTDTIEPLVGVTHTKNWTDELLTFDLDKMVMFHRGDSEDGGKLTKVTPTNFFWDFTGTPDLTGKPSRTMGEFNRVGMTGREEFKALDVTFVNHYDSCRIAKARI